MKLFISLIILLAAAASAIAQNEQAPIQTKDIVYKDWTLKNVRTGVDTNLRKLAAGNKLVMVIYFAPWCENWQHDEPFIQKFYEKYKSDGLEIVGIAEYDSVDATDQNLTAFNITFPVVQETRQKTDRETSLHHQYRVSTGDTPKMGLAILRISRTRKDVPQGRCTRHQYVDR